MSADQQKTPMEGLTSANLCCLAGVALVVYAAFLLHSAAGCFVSGAFLVAFGVLRNRMASPRDPKSR